MLLIGEQKNCSTERKINLTVYFYSAGLQALLAEGVADFEIMWKTKLLASNCHNVEENQGDPPVHNKGPIGLDYIPAWDHDVT